MAYGTNPTGPVDPVEPTGEADAMSEGGYDEEATTTLPASVTGGKKFNAGDEIVLEVVEPMEDGSLVVKYATGKGDDYEGGEDEGANWEEDFRKEMSPREPQQEAM